MPLLVVRQLAMISGVSPCAFVAQSHTVVPRARPHRTGDPHHDSTPQKRAARACDPVLRFGCSDGSAEERAAADDAGASEAVRRQAVAAAAPGRVAGVAAEGFGRA